MNNEEMNKETGMWIEAERVLYKGLPGYQLVDFRMRDAEHCPYKYKTERMDSVFGKSGYIKAYWLERKDSEMAEFLREFRYEIGAKFTKEQYEDIIKFLKRCKQNFDEYAEEEQQMATVWHGTERVVI